MPITTAKELVVATLTELRHRAGWSPRSYQELGEVAQNPETREARNLRELVSSQISTRLRFIRVAGAGHHCASDCEILSHAAEAGNIHRCSGTRVLAEDDRRRAVIVDHQSHSRHGIPCINRRWLEVTGLTSV
jgi:hypothetical protein